MTAAAEPLALERRTPSFPWSCGVLIDRGAATIPLVATMVCPLMSPCVSLTRFDRSSLEDTWTTGA